LHNRLNPVAYFDFNLSHWRNSQLERFKRKWNVFFFVFAFKYKILSVLQISIFFFLSFLFWSIQFELLNFSTVNQF
jgi:hypothetical protein